MSGPKRADVQAALDQVARTARSVSQTIGKAQDGAIRALAKRLEDEAGQARQLEDQLRALEKELGPLGTPEARRALLTAKAARDRMADLARRRTDIGSSIAEIDRLAKHAVAAHASAQRQYDDARASLGRGAGGGHYMNQEMASATAARQAFTQAAAVVARAGAARDKAQEAATRALELSHAALSGGQQALDQAEVARRAVVERDRARVEAQRIAEEARRAAVEVLQEASIALDALDAGTVDRFLPGARQRLSEAVAAGRRRIDDGRFADVRPALGQVAGEAERIADEAAELKSRYDEALARAQADAAELDAVIVGTDEQVVAQWATQGEAVRAARQAASEVARAIAAEDFDGAAEIAERTKMALAAAVADAAKAMAQDVRRTEIGDAVMDVLEELGFETSCEDGSRDRALKISGQTANETGRGDFEIEIPLDGEVDFEVKADEGDTACATVIRDLQTKLAGRGIAWNVTDWGHATGSEGQTRIQTRTQTQTRSQTPG